MAVTRMQCWGGGELQDGNRCTEDERVMTLTGALMCALCIRLAS